MKTQIAPSVTVNRKSKLYVIPCGQGYSCLGFQVCADRVKRLASELGADSKLSRLGSLKNYHELQRLQALAAERNRATGWRARCELSPQLVGLEGRRVEVVTTYGETRRFQVGKSTGFNPIHLEVSRRNSMGGVGAERHYKSVRVIR